MPTKKSSKKTTKKDANEASTEPLSNSEVADFLERQRKFQSSLRQQWKNRLSPEILGQRIVRLRYMTKKEAEGFGWYSCPLMMQLENGTWLIPSKDDEMNDGGATHLNNKDRELKETLAPVITIADD
jgi:hypothetical protein